MDEKQEKFARLVSLTQELKRRKEHPLSKYNTGKKKHKKQVAFHRSKKRNRWVFGGNRSGKSECGAVEVVWMALGIHPFRENRKFTEGWVVSLSTRVQKDVAQKKILNYLDPKFIDQIVMQSGSSSAPEFGVIDKIVVKNVFGNKSVIGFKSCEEGRDKFQGASLDYVWFDEEPPKEIYDECLMRTIDKKGDIFGTMTPLKGRSFVYDEIYLNPRNDKEIFTIFFEWKDNPFISKAEVKRMKKILTQDELESREFGRFRLDKMGKVYPDFSEGNNVIEPFSFPKEWQRCLSIDPGLFNPTSCHWYCVDGDGNIFVVAEHFLSGETVSYHAKKIKEISDALGWHKNFSGEIDALIDSASTQKTLASIKSVAEMFREEGIAVNPKVNKNLFDGIIKVREYIRGDNHPKLFVFNTCVNLIRELKTYHFKDDDIPLKDDDHALDELRYFVMSLPAVSKPQNQIVLTEIQKDKRKLMRNLRNNRN